MYIPAAFAVTEAQKLQAFMRENSFAVLCSWQAKQLQATHVPLLLEEGGAHGTLVGHMAKANEQHLVAGSEVMAVFHGAHAYVSPTWYGEPGFVPTWNYVAVHAYGTLQMIDDPQEVLGVLRRTVEFFEPEKSAAATERGTAENPLQLPLELRGRETPAWRMEGLGREKLDGLLKAIVAFKIPLSRIEGKWKLSQNHTPIRRARVAAALQQATDSAAREISVLMREDLRARERAYD